jgi:hypothetical protein
MEQEDSDRTVYSIRDEYGEKSSITLDKFTADTLQKYLPNVHEWVQKTYSRVAKKKSELGRRERAISCAHWHSARLPNSSRVMVNSMTSEPPSSTPHADTRVSAVLCKGSSARAGGRGRWTALE